MLKELFIPNLCGIIAMTLWEKWVPSLEVGNILLSSYGMQASIDWTKHIEKNFVMRFKQYAVDKKALIVRE